MADESTTPSTPAAAAPGYVETPSDPVSAEQRRAEQAKEYGTFIALGPIDHDGARAYNTGDAVPAANVERWDYLNRGLVARRSTKAAGAVQESLRASVGTDYADEVARALLTQQTSE